MPPSPLTLSSGSQLGRYRVVRKLAEGGMSEVYLCSAPSAVGGELQAVVKRPRADLASKPEGMKMFEREARLLSKLRHPNLVRVLDFGADQGRQYLAMEYVHGRSLQQLRQRLRERARAMPIGLASYVAAQVAAGLHHAHTLTERGRPVGLVHRDVTPDNVLLSYSGEVKLTDFGVAKVASHVSCAGSTKGKLPYMSPEQARGEPVAATTDVFALGVVLWEMLTGGRLFEGPSAAAVYEAIQTRLVAPPRRLNPAVPKGLDAAVMGALERDPARRLPSAQALEAALTPFVAPAAAQRDLGALLHRLFAHESTAGMPTPPCPREHTRSIEPTEPVVEVELLGPAPGPGTGNLRNQLVALRRSPPFTPSGR